MLHHRICEVVTHHTPTATLTTGFVNPVVNVLRLLKIMFVGKVEGKLAREKLWLKWEDKMDRKVLLRVALR